jgi:hypothetical protein
VYSWIFFVYSESIGCMGSRPGFKSEGDIDEAPAGGTVDVAGGAMLCALAVAERTTRRSAAGQSTRR